MKQRSISQESEMGEELFTLAELVRLNPQFTVDQLRKWIQIGRLEAIRYSNGGMWWTSEEALQRATQKLKRRRKPHANSELGMSERAKEVLRRRCGYTKTRDGQYRLLKECESEYAL